VLPYQLRDVGPRDLSPEDTEIFLATLPPRKAEPIPSTPPPMARSLNSLLAMQAFQSLARYGPPIIGTSASAVADALSGPGPSPEVFEPLFNLFRATPSPTQPIQKFDGAISVSTLSLAGFDRMFRANLAAMTAAASAARLASTMPAVTPFAPGEDQINAEAPKTEESIVASSVDSEDLSEISSIEDGEQAVAKAEPGQEITAEDVSSEETSVKKPAVEKVVARTSDSNRLPESPSSSDFGSKKEHGFGDSRYASDMERPVVRDDPPKTFAQVEALPPTSPRTKPARSDGSDKALNISPSSVEVDMSDEPEVVATGSSQAIGHHDMVEPQAAPAAGSNHMLPNAWLSRETKAFGNVDPATIFYYDDKLTCLGESSMLQTPQHAFHMPAQSNTPVAMPTIQTHSMFNAMPSSMSLLIFGDMRMRSTARASRASADLAAES
jgi:hypothetical protein